MNTTPKKSHAHNIACERCGAELYADLCPECDVPGYTDDGPDYGDPPDWDGPETALDLQVGAKEL